MIKIIITRPAYNEKYIHYNMEIVTITNTAQNRMRKNKVQKASSKKKKWKNNQIAQIPLIHLYLHLRRIINHCGNLAVISKTLTQSKHKIPRRAWKK